MKAKYNLLTKLLTLTVFLSLLSFATGCSGLDKLVTGTDLRDPGYSQTVTNDAGEVVINEPAVRPSIDTSLDVIGSLPIPFAGTAALAIGWMLQLYVTLRAKNVNKGLVLSIESVRRWLNETEEGRKMDTAIRNKLIDAQNAQGIMQEVRQLVDRYTAATRD